VSVRGFLRRAFGRRERVVPVVLPGTRRAWRRAGPGDRASRLHLLYLERRDEVQPAYFARSGWYPMPRPGVARVWRWFVGDVAVQSLRLVRRNGRPVREAAGVPVRRQVWDLLRMSVTVPSMPEKYYMFEWYRPEHRARARDYLHRHETKGGLYELLAVSPDLEAVAPLNDKVGFAGHARRAGLAVVETLAVIGDDGGRTGGGELPATDLFVKPLAGRGGRGAQRWTYLPGTDSFRRAERGGDVPRDRLPAELAGEVASTGLPVMVQRCLVNHPDLADLALDALATCRVITILDERGEPQPVIAIIRMAAVRGAVVDNMHRGGLAAPVDIDTGVMGAASGYAVAGPAPRYTHHPVTGGPIGGRKVPLWDGVRALAVEAHRAFRPRVLVGWDIGVSPSGPVLVEGNEQPGVDGLQRVHDTPLGSHRFGELLAFHLLGG
jgi:hypothetical protein